ncbi:hypothetical protein GCM10023321_28100 [Pseudonocardia eucalypti]|uniref:Lipoprotein n=1 Tax=Pseudonocardia eucalypti TaxID=648755 RepID=A0ABP9Q0L5_9PSEU|nr:hypothetical protein [Pseudonocardia eucalypti]
MTNRAIRAAEGLLLAGVAAFSLAACGGPQVPAAPPSAAPPSASQLRFPNTDVTAQLVGFDAAAGMVRFQVVHRVAGGADNGHYEPDPSDSATHRLPLAARPTVLSALTLCSTEITVDDRGDGNRPCTREQLVAVLSRGTSVLARLHVDGTDHIDRVSELYQP